MRLIWDITPEDVAKFTAFVDGMKGNRFVTDRIDISAHTTLASELGHWIAKDHTGAITHTGTYAAMWRQTTEGWKLRSELYITLTS